MHAGSGHWCSSLPPTPAFPRMKTSNLNPNQDVYLRPKPQRHFKQAKFLTYFADQVQSFMPVTASLHPGGCGGSLLPPARCCPTAQVGARIIPWDQGPGGILWCPHRAEHSNTSGCPQLSSVVAQILGDLPMTLPSPQQPHSVQWELVLTS